MRVAFADLARSTAALRPELDNAISRVLERGWYILGEEGQAFEREFAEWCGVRYAVGVASGTDAIELSLRALGIGAGAEVVTQANTCVPTVAAIERAGATPVLCDVEADSGTMDPDSLQHAIGPQTRAIVPVHLYGQCADLDAILDVAGDIPVVEDCAQAHGAEVGSRRAGTIGVAGCFSFYPTKNLGALGDGGMVVTDDGELAERLRLVRQYGQVGRYDHVMQGVNSRLDEFQAAALRVKLPHLDAWNARRTEIATAYDEALGCASVRPLLRLPARRHVFHLYVVKAPDREAFRLELDRAGVATLVHYPSPIHRHRPYRMLANQNVSLMNSERLCAEVVSLPLFPEMSDAEVTHVAQHAGAAAQRQAARFGTY